MNVHDRLWQGSIDIHIHGGPDPVTTRRFDALRLGQQAQDAGMRAIVLKSHEYPTAPVAYLVNQIVRNVAVLGSICLNFAVGGLNSSAVEASAKMGAKMVWMPTNDAAGWMKKKGLGGPGITLLDERGKLLPVVGEILDIIKSYDMVLATGHISVPEIIALVDEAARRGVTRIVITHPLLRRTLAEFSLEEQRRLGEKGAFIEHCWAHVLPTFARMDPADMVKATRLAGIEHTIWSTDLGIDSAPAPAEGMRVMIATMLKYGLTEKEVEVLVKANPGRLLGLE